MASDQRYRVIDRLESGGMAEVFRAESVGLQGFKKQVAIKRVLSHLAAKDTFIKMFLDEARLSARLSHSNCVQVFDIGVGDGTYFIVMEFVDGANLRGIIDTLKAAGRPFPVEAAVYIAIELAKGLQYAHGLCDENGAPLHIVHRDMSPPNVLITKHGEIKIVDFGLAKANTQLERSEPGIIKGKFSYLAPEAARGQDVDARADIFAIGIMLWELLAGRRLFLGKTDLETVQMVQRAIVPPITRLRADVPAELEPILARALASDPNERYSTARELGCDLNAFLYRFGQQPISDFEIADLVLSAMEQRRREREAAKASGVEQFLQWANEVVFQFQSLDQAQTMGSTALDARSLLGPLSPDALPAVRRNELRQPNSMLPGLPSLTSGDLSKLEEDDSLGSFDSDSGPEPQTRATSAQDDDDGPEPETLPVPQVTALATAPTSSAEAADFRPSLLRTVAKTKLMLIIMAISVVVLGVWAVIGRMLHN